MSARRAYHLTNVDFLNRYSYPDNIEQNISLFFIIFGFNCGNYPLDYNYMHYTITN